MRLQAQKPLLSLKPKFRTLETQVLRELTAPPIRDVIVKSATVESYKGIKNRFLSPSALTTVKMEFGQIDENQFQSLKEEFGGKSSVQYQADKSYSAKDFLPPALQALLGQDLEIPERASLPSTAGWELVRPYEEDKSVDLTANCHGTTWEAVQAIQGQDDLDIFFGDALFMDDSLEDLKYFRKLREFTPQEVDTKNLEQMELQPGDVVAFHNPSGFSVTNLLHTATYVGGGLYFEKPDTESREEDAPYRLGTADTITEPLRYFLGETPKIKIYRPSQELPRPEVSFHADSFDGQAAWEQSLGQPVGMPLLAQNEFSMGGGMSGQYITTLADQSVVLDEFGLGVLPRSVSK